MNKQLCLSGIRLHRVCFNCGLKHIELSLTDRPSTPHDAIPAAWKDNGISVHYAALCKEDLLGTCLSSWLWTLWQLNEILWRLWWTFMWMLFCNAGLRTCALQNKRVLLVIVLQYSSAWDLRSISTHMCQRCKKNDIFCWSELQDIRI